MLQLIKADVVSVENGALAVSAVETEAFDLVLKDLQMPVMDGLAAIRAIRDHERRTGGPSLPIIVLSANVAPADRAATAAAGACAHIGKPIRVEDLIEAIAAAVDAAPIGAVA